MSEVIAWCGFFGAWLLVAGPIYQAALDLDDEDFEREEFARTVAHVPPPPHISRWWLLVPPVAYVLRARRNRAHIDAVLDALSPLQVEQALHFRETASAWMFVAAGAFLLAVAETWGLRIEYAWPFWAFWVLLVVMLVVCLANTVMRVRRRQAIIEQARP